MFIHKVCLKIWNIVVGQMSFLPHITYSNMYCKRFYQIILPSADFRPYWRVSGDMKRTPHCWAVLLTNYINSGSYVDLTFAIITQRWISVFYPNSHSIKNFSQKQSLLISYQVTCLKRNRSRWNVHKEGWELKMRYRTSGFYLNKNGVQWNYIDTSAEKQGFSHSFK